MDFVAIDVETANANMASICQIGLARFREGSLVEEWVSLIDPEEYFDEVNIGIHGIDEQDVVGQPVLPEVLQQLAGYLDGAVCVCHTHFDRVSMSRAFAKYQIAPIDIRWLDSARVARRAWKEFAYKGYGLASVCQKIGYTFQHHDALEDAKAAGYVMIAAAKEAGLDLDGWQKRVALPINSTNLFGGVTSGCLEANPEGALFGEVIVFTGALEITRAEAAALAANVGCNVGDGVTKKTTLLVVGDQDIAKLLGSDKSTKHRKAEQLIGSGQSIRILSESDFKQMVAQS